MAANPGPCCPPTSAVPSSKGFSCTTETKQPQKSPIINRNTQGEVSPRVRDLAHGGLAWGSRPRPQPLPGLPQCRGAGSQSPFPTEALSLSGKGCWQGPGDERASVGSRLHSRLNCGLRMLRLPSRPVPPQGCPACMLVAQPAWPAHTVLHSHGRQGLQLTQRFCRAGRPGFAPDGVNTRRPAVPVWKLPQHSPQPRR